MDLRKGTSLPTLARPWEYCVATPYPKAVHSGKGRVSNERVISFYATVVIRRPS